jgi:transcriptional regulator with XRE-family HTH domain
MDADRVRILADDLEVVREQLEGFAGYDFAFDLAARMEGLGLSQSALAGRALVSHAMVGKWLNKGAKPHGKERFKELGMALGMDAEQLNGFLAANCYPRLYAKNPLDIACRFLLANAAEAGANIVRIYRDFLRVYKLDGYVLREDPADAATAVLSREFAAVNSMDGLREWYSKNDKHFRAFDKAYIPHAELISFAHLYIGGQSIRDLYITGELPLAIRNLLYPLVADKEVAVRKLRAKLIVFGLYENMCEDEVDIMLNIVKLQPFTLPLSRVDRAVLTSLRCFHERYPYFELANAEAALERLRENGLVSLAPFYEEQRRRAAEFAAYYETEGRRTEEERMFEKFYADSEGRGALSYSRDMLELLTEAGALTEAEAGEYTALMRTYGNDEPYLSGYGGGEE